MKETDIFREAIIKSSSSPNDMILDLSTLLYWMRQSNENQSADDIISTLEQSTDLNQDIVLQIKEKSNSADNKKFKPILDRKKDPSSVERLAIFLIHDETFQRKILGVSSFHDIITESIEQSNENIISIFSMAIEVEHKIKDEPEYFYSTIKWNGYVIPSLLNKFLQDEENKIQLVSIASGLEITSESELFDIQRWVAKWIDKNSTSKYINGSEVLGLDPDGKNHHSEWDGIFEPQKHRPGYVPASLNPLVLSILRDKKYFKDSHNNVNESVIERFCLWLSKKIFEDKTSSKYGPEIGFSLASFVLYHGKQHGIQITQSNIVSNQFNQFWAGIIERILEFVKDNSQAKDSTLQSWKDQRDLIIKILIQSPDWYSTSLQNYIKNMMSKEIEHKFKLLKEYFLNEYDTIKTDDFYPPVETSEFSQLQDLRPSGPLMENPEELTNYEKKSSFFNNNLYHIENRTKKIIYQSQMAFDLRKDFESTSVSPFSDSILLDKIFEGKPINPALNSYLKSEICKLSLISKEREDKDGTVAKTKTRSLFDNKAWISFVNRNMLSDSDSDKDALLESWANLELFDKLRARFVTLGEEQKKEGDSDLISYIYENLVPNWLKEEDEPIPVLNDAELESLRPVLSALMFLGISPTATIYSKLVGNIEKRIKSLSDNPTDDEKKYISFLTSCRLELGISLISAGYDFFTAFSKSDDGPLGTDIDRITKVILPWIGYSLKSTNAWELRVGTNMLITISRISETIGDQRYFVEELVGKVLDSSVINRIIVYCLNLMLTDISSDNNRKMRSGLVMSLIAEDLTRYTREISSSPADTVIDPHWFKNSFFPTISNVMQLINELIDRFENKGMLPLSHFTADGGLPGKNLIICLFQFQLAYVNMQHRQLTVKPLTSNNKSYKKLLSLLKILRSLFCTEMLFVRGFQQTENPDQINESETPWWKISYWNGASLLDKDLADGSMYTSDPMFTTDNPAYSEKLDRESIPYEMFSAAGEKPSTDARIIVMKTDRKVVEGTNQERLQGLEWMIIDIHNSFIIKRGIEDNNVLVCYKLRPSYPLINWMNSFHQAEIGNALLHRAATLEQQTPCVSKVEEYDIDKRLFGDFPIYNYQHQKNELTSEDGIIKRLKNLEDEYVKEIDIQIQGTKLDSIIEHLKKPLFLNTADYKQQIESALDEVLEAEAELGVAEHESLAAEFEVLSCQLMHEAAQLEYERSIIFEEIEKDNHEIELANQEINRIEKIIGEQTEEKIKNNKEKAKYEIEKIKLKRNIAQRTAKTLSDEVKIIRKALGIPGPGLPIEQIPQETKSGKLYLGQIAIMALRIEEKLLVKLEKELKDTEVKLENAKSKERARRKKARRNKLIRSVCRMVGAVVGAIYGGPAGAKLGAEIGEMVGELYTSVLDNKPMGDIVLGLADNALNISELSGVNVEKQLDILYTKDRSEIKGVFANLNSTLEPYLNTMPNIWNKKMINEAFNVLDIDDPQLKELINKTYENLKTDSQNSQNLGNLVPILQNIKIEDPIGFGNPREFLTQLNEHLFKNASNDTSLMESLAKAVGEDIIDLTTEKKKTVTTNISKAVVTKLGYDSSYFRADTIHSWITFRKKQIAFNQNKTWESIREEAQTLVNRLYTDPSKQIDALSNIEMNFIDPNLMQGKMQKIMEPWQQEFDHKIEEIMKTPDDTKPNSEVEAYESSVKTLKKAIELFKNKLLPWLRGDSNDQLRQLRLDLEEKVQKELDAMAELEIIEIDVDKAQIDWINYSIDSLNIEQEIKKIDKYYDISKLKINQASLQMKAARLANLKYGKIMEAEKFSENAAKAKQDASLKRIEVMKYRIKSKQALLEAATRRGAEASIIRTGLNQPPLEYNISKNKLARIRIEFVNTLKVAFKYYREMLRFAISSGLRLATEDSLDGDDIEISVPYSTDNLGIKPKWSNKFDDWIKKIENIMESKISISFPTPIVYELTPLQVQSLFSEKGFSTIIGSHIREKEEFFRIGLHMSRFLDGNTILGDKIFIVESDRNNQDSLYSKLVNELGSQVIDTSSNWQKKFNEEKISFPDNAKITEDEQEQDLWYIREQGSKILYSIEKKDDVQLIIYKRNPLIDEFNKYGINLYKTSKITKRDPGLWEIAVPSNGRMMRVYPGGKPTKENISSPSSFDINNDEKYTFEIEKDQSSNSLVIYRIYRKETGEKRSPAESRYQNYISKSKQGMFTRNGMITAVYLEPIFHPPRSFHNIAKDDYIISIKHTGDTFYSDKYPKKESVRFFTGENNGGLELEQWRADFISKGINTTQKFKDDINMSEIQGFPDVLKSRLGIPLFGKTVISLQPNGTAISEFDTMKIHILYSLWERRI